MTHMPIQMVSPGVHAQSKKEAELKNAIARRWEAGKKDRLELGRDLLELREMLAGKGRDGEFSPWLRSQGIPRTLAYYYISLITNEKCQDFDTSGLEEQPDAESSATWATFGFGFGGEKQSPPKRSFIAALRTPQKPIPACPAEATSESSGSRGAPACLWLLARRDLQRDIHCAVRVGQLQRTSGDEDNLVQNFVLSFFSNQLLKVVHNFVTPSHDGLDLLFIEKPLRSCCQLIAVECFQFGEKLPVTLR